jgi:hypothetical protein
MRSSSIVTAGILVLLWVSSAAAHHAMEYIEMESYSTARRGEAVFHVHYDYMIDDAENPRADHWEYTPGLAYGATDRLMFDVHTHFAKFGEDHIVEEKRAEYEGTGTSPFLEAAAATVQYRLTEGMAVDVGISGTIEVPFSRARSLLGSEDNVYAGMLILSKDFGVHANVTANLLYEQEGEENGTGWAVGIKTPISADPHGIAAGVEVLGDFENVAWAVLPGVYAPLGDGIVFKTGLALGQEEVDGESTDTLRASVSLMYRF